MINGRQKGHHFERKFAEFLRIWGWEAMTSRSESRNLDNLGVDLVDNTPFYFQLKHVERSINIHKILRDMPEDKIRVVVHKRNNNKTTVTLYLDDFANLNLSKDDN